MTYDPVFPCVPSCPLRKGLGFVWREVPLTLLWHLGEVKSEDDWHDDDDESRRIGHLVEISLWQLKVWSRSRKVKCFITISLQFLSVCDNFVWNLKDFECFVSQICEGFRHHVIRLHVVKSRDLACVTDFNRVSAPCNNKRIVALMTYEHLMFLMKIAWGHMRYLKIFDFKSVLFMLKINLNYMFAEV